MSHITVNSREQLEALIKNKPKTVAQKACPICGYKTYRIFIKGQEKWMGCKCRKIKKHHYV